MTSLGIVDYGSGNLYSVMRAFEHCGARPVLGAPKKQKFEVTGVAAGEAKLVFNYVKSGDAAPAKTAEYVVEVIGSDPE